MSSTERWVGQRIFLYRHPVDMRNYALPLVMRFLPVVLVQNVVFGWNSEH